MGTQSGRYPVWQTMGTQSGRYPVWQTMGTQSGRYPVWQTMRDRQSGSRLWMMWAPLWYFFLLFIYLILFDYVFIPIIYLIKFLFQLSEWNCIIQLFTYILCTFYYLSKADNWISFFQGLIKYYCIVSTRVVPEVTALPSILVLDWKTFTQAISECKDRWRGNIHFWPHRFAILKWFEDACVHVLVYSTGIVRNELICGYSNVVHTSSSFRPHTHIPTHACTHACMHTHANTHTVDILITFSWGPRTDGAKSGHCLSLSLYQCQKPGYFATYVDLL